MYTAGDMIRLGDVLWWRVNSCWAARSVSFHVGGAVLALIIVRGPRLMIWGVINCLSKFFLGLLPPLSHYYIQVAR